MNRRRFFNRTALGALGAGIFTGWYTWQIEPFWLEFVRRKMPVRQLPDQLIGKSLMQISDVHVGDRFDFGYIIESFKSAQALEPDFVVYTGDFVSYESKKQFSQLREVLQYTVKGTHGTFGILGNHDYGYNWAEQAVADQIGEQLQHAGIQVLQNEQIEVEASILLGSMTIGL